MPTLTSLIVGAHFHPPAKAILGHLPAGARLRLEPEPTNPYDPDAVRVMASPADIPASEYPSLEIELPLMGHSLPDVLAMPKLWLGYVARAGNKDLAKWPGLASAPALRDALAGAPDAQASLAFGPDGGARVCLVTPD